MSVYTLRLNKKSMKKGTLSNSFNYYAPIFLRFSSFLHKTPVTYSQMYRQIVAGFLIWKMLSDLRIIFSARTAICNIRNVIVASATDALCPWGCHGKIKLLDLSVKALQILSVIYIRSSPVSHHSSSLTVLIVRIPILDVLVAFLTSLTLPQQKISIKTLTDLTGSATD